MTRPVVPLDRRFVALSKEARELDADSLLIRALASGFSEGWPELLARPCVVVLGEAGTGKTTEFKEQAGLLATKDESAFFLRLEELAVQELHRCLHPRELADFERWQSETTRGYFFLDSLDEARLGRGSLDAALRNLFYALGSAASRAGLFVSCRVSDWRFDADESVLESFVKPANPSQQADDGAPGKSPVHVVQIMPLRPEQVRLLASHHRVDDLDAFERAVAGAHTHAFVERPKDVEWLCGYWNQHRSIGTLTELIESNITEKLKERSERRSTLGADRAREGVTRLAGIATLSGHRSFALPESGVGPAEPVPSIAPSVVLKDWSDDEIQQLFTRPIFDESTYGRMRIHHRSVQEYLGAKWLHGLLEQGMPRRHLYHLLFPRVAGDQVVPDHLQGPVAWLALWDDEVRRRVMAIAPEILIGLGDPNGLSEDDRKAALRAYAARYAGRARRYEWFEHASLARFASPAIAELINELLVEPQHPGELQNVLLQMIAEKQLEACVPTALRMALDQGTVENVRYYAISAVAKAGTPQQKHELLGLLDRMEDWDQDVAGCFIEELFPEILSISGLLDVLERVRGVRANLHTHLQWVLRFVLPGKLDTGQRMDLLTTLLSFTSQDTESTGARALRPGQRLLLQSMGRLLAALLDDPLRQGVPPVVLETLDLLRDFRQQPWEYGQLTDVVDSLKCHADVRQELFWRWVARRKTETGKAVTRYRDVRYDCWLSKLSSDDIAWLAQDAMSRYSVQDRLLAFDVLWYVPVAEAQQEYKNELLDQLATTHEALKKRRARMLNPRIKIGVDYAFRTKYWARVHANRDARRQAESHAFLTSVMEEIRSGQHVDGLIFLHSCTTTNNTVYGDVSVDRVQEQYGDEIASAFCAGMKTFWRGYEPSFRHEREERNSTPYGVILGLAGLALDVADGLDVAALDDDLGEKAIRYAVAEINRFPPWLTTIAEAKPALIQQALRPAVKLDYEYQDQGVPDDDVVKRLPGASKPARRASAPVIYDVLDKLARASEPVRMACAPVIAELLRTGDPPLPGTLCIVLEVLLSTPESDVSVIADLAEERCNAASNEPERFATWWCAWFERAGQTALNFLEPLLKAQKDSAARELVMQICNRLHQWTESYATVTMTFHRDARTLGRLIPLVYQTIAPDDDVHHEGAYVMGHRDHAERIRSRLVGWLSAIPSEETVHTFRSIADVPHMAKYRDWFLYQAEQAAGHTDSIAPMSPDQALRWSSEHVPVIRSSDDLFRVACDRLDDIRLEMEQGDFTYRDLFNRPGEHVQESDAQKWLVSELRRRARGHYSVTPEEEIDHKQRPDIRLYHPGCGPVSVEVKIAEKWTYNQLASALEHQLVGQYLRAVNSNHGIFLLCSMGKGKSWKSDGNAINFADLLARLAQKAEDIAARREDVAALRVIGINFHDPASAASTGAPGKTPKKTPRKRK